MGHRILYLVRHGQYQSHSQPADNLGGGLTEIGKHQAQLTAERLGRLPIDAIYHSTLHRARETAEIIATQLPDVPLRSSELLCECIPCVPPGMADHFTHIAAETLAAGERQVAEAFERYFKRTRGSERHEVLVCHGNIIRYFICRALRVAPEIWVNTDVHHCGISQILVNNDGSLMLISHNDTGHLTDDLRTFI